jgi:hypothetical protein
MNRLLPFPLLFALTASSATYYVSPSGSDRNPGASAQPWKTIQNAANAMQAGDTTIVESGYYSEKVVSTANGTASSPITFLAQAGVTNADGFNVTKDEVPVYEPGPGGAYVGFVISISGVGNVLKNFQLGNISSTNGIANTNNYSFYNLAIGGAFNVVSNGNLFNINATVVNISGKSNLVVNCLINNTFGNDCFHAGGTNNIIRGCVVSNIVMAGASDTGVHSDFVQWAGSYGSSARGLLVEQCTTYPGVYQICNLSQDGLDVGGYTFRNNLFLGAVLHASIYTHDTAFYNNILVDCGTNTSDPLFFYDAPATDRATNCSVFNNLFIECGDYDSQANRGWYAVGAGVTNSFHADNNYVCGFNWAAKNTKTNDHAFLEPHGINGGNPGLVSFSFTNQLDWATNSHWFTNAGFHLLANSILRNAGTNLSAIFATDKNNAVRPVGSAWDIGAYEYAPVVPVVNAILLSGRTNLIISGTNGLPNRNYLVLASTNLFLPPTNWMCLSTNSIDGSGNFIFTNPATPNTPRLFYLLQLQ